MTFFDDFKAFGQSKNVLLIKRNGKVEGVRPKILERKTDISIKNVDYKEQDDVKKFVEQITNSNSVKQSSMCLMALEYHL
jgi:hypothetical protein